MVLPIGDAPNPRGVPVVTYLLIAANVAVYALITLPLSGVAPAPGDPVLAEYVRVMTRELGDRVPLSQLLGQVSAYDLFVFTHAFRPAAPSVSGLFVSMFLHGGLLHLAGNMLFLWIYGDNVEHRLGRVSYLGWYLACGAAASFFHAAGDLGSNVPMVGASGAISGVLGFYFIWFPRNVVRLLWLLPPFLMDVFVVPARLVLGLYLIADNLLPYLVGGGAGGVAHGAHIGGFVAGVAVAWVKDRRGVNARPPEYAVEVEPPAAADGIGGAIRAGRMANAARAYFALPVRAARGALAPDEALALAEWLRDGGHVDAALIVLRRLVRDHPRGPGLAEAHVLLGELLLEDLDQPTPAYQHFLAALDLPPPPDVAARARRGLAAIEALQKRRIGHAHVPRT